MVATERLSENKHSKEVGDKNANPKQSTFLAHLLMDTAYGYVFWSLFHGLPPMIWFYPLNELDVTGYEVFVAVVLVPILTLPSGTFALLQKSSTLACLRLISVASLACSFHASTTLLRLVILSVGTAASILVIEACLWTNASTYKRFVSGMGLLLAFVLLLVSRIWYTSLLPTWCDFTTNKVICGLALITTIQQISSGYDKSFSGDTSKLENARRKDPWLRTGIGLGSYLYLIHGVFGEVSIPFRWIVQGYPNVGPSPNPGGAFVLIAVVLGLWLASKLPQVATSFFWWLTGSLGFVALYYLTTYSGFAGGLVLAVYTFSVWTEMWKRATLCSPALVLTTAMATCIAEIFFSIWTIAYNFVPGGEYTREHTDYLIGFVMLTIGLALLIGHNDEPKLSRQEKSFQETCAAMIRTMLLLLMSIGLFGFANRWQVQKPSDLSPKLSHPKDFTALIWTYHFAYDNSGWPSLERTADLLRDTGADVIALLETDASKPFLGNNDLAMWLGEHLNMHVDFGPATRDHTWGNLLLSRYPIVKSSHHLLPSPQGELAPAISATVNISGHLVDVVSTHMGNDRDTFDRKLQADYLSELLNKSENPVIFLGYVTSPPGSRDYVQLTTVGRVQDIDPTDWERWCEYIFYRGFIRLGYARLSRGILSDTELQMARFRIPSHSSNYKDNSRTETDPSMVSTKQQLFNPRFGGFFKNHYYGDDHHYHMDTPKYFLP